MSFLSPLRSFRARSANSLAARVRRLSNRKREDGFTLVELMVVIVIIGLLATIVVVNVLPSVDRANETRARSDITTIENALEMYRLDNFAYPTTAEGLQALTTPPPTLADPGRYRRGGYIRRLENDPWGRAYLYTNPGREGRPFDVFTYGADGQEGGDGENADIGTWQ